MIKNRKEVFDLCLKKDGIDLLVRSLVCKEQMRLQGESVTLKYTFYHMEATNSFKCTGNIDFLFSKRLK